MYMGKIQTTLARSHSNDCTIFINPISHTPQGTANTATLTIAVTLADEVARSCRSHDFPHPRNGVPAQNRLDRISLSGMLMVESHRRPWEGATQHTLNDSFCKLDSPVPRFGMRFVHLLDLVRHSASQTEKTMTPPQTTILAILVD